MKNIKISKIVILIITFMLIACMSATVFAEGELNFENIAGDTSGNTTDDGIVDDLSNSINTETPGNTTTEGNTSTDGNTQVQPENQTTQDNSTSDLPHAGVEDTILMITAFIVCAIIGIYTFIKLSEYSNI